MFPLQYTYSSEGLDDSIDLDEDKENLENIDIIKHVQMKVDEMNVSMERLFFWSNNLPYFKSVFPVALCWSNLTFINGIAFSKAWFGQHVHGVYSTRLSLLFLFQEGEPGNDELENVDKRGIADSSFAAQHALRKAELSKQLQELTKALTMKEELASKMVDNDSRITSMKKQHEVCFKDLAIAATVACLLCVDFVYLDYTIILSISDFPGFAHAHNFLKGLHADKIIKMKRKGKET